MLASVFNFLVFLSPTITVTGKVTDSDGLPIWGAEVSIGNLTAVTDGEGMYMLNIPSKFLQKTVEVLVNHTGFTPQKLQFTPSDSKCSCNATLSKELSPVNVEGKVTDETGLPISGANVTVGNETTLTGLNGSYTLICPQGLCNVSVVATGFESQNTTLNATASTVSPNNGTLPKIVHDVTLKPTGSGTLQQSNGTFLFNSPSCVWNQQRIGVDGCRCRQNESVPLFIIRGTPETSYMRNLAGEKYGNGSWTMYENSSTIQYVGGPLAQEPSNVTTPLHSNIEIQPLTGFGGFIPSIKNPLQVWLSSPLQYYLDQQVFFSGDVFRNSYNVSSAIYNFDFQTLTKAETVSSGKYLELPPELAQELTPLALNVTGNAETQFEKALAIEDFIRRNYIYNVSYASAPAGTDPVEWFLFHSKSGVCIHFNSAFVLMARSVGIPARLCTGYLINPASQYQTVFSKQRHAYAEVPFENLGWITFDATAACPCAGNTPAHTTFKIWYPSQDAFISGSRITLAGVAQGFRKDAELSVNSTSFALTYWNDVDGDFIFDNSSFIDDGKLALNVSISDFAGNDASGTVEFTVDNTPPKVTVLYPSEGSHVLSSTIVINGTVEEINKGLLEPFINDSRFTLEYWNESAGTFSYTNTSSFQGEVSLQVSFRDLAGNNGKGTVTFYVDAPTSVQISTITTITFCSPVGIKGSTFYVEGRVVDVNGTAVSELNVLIFIAKNKNETGALCGQGKIFEGFFNVTCNVPVEIKVGEYVVLAHTLGDGTYRESWSDPSITIMAETELAVSIPEEVIMGRSFIVNCTLKEKLTGEPVGNQKILIFDAEQNLTLSTSENGVAVSNCTLWNLGNHTVTLIFNGSATYLNSTISKTVRVLNITVSPTTNTTLIRLQETFLTGRVYAEHLPVDNEPLTISLNYVQIAETYTDSSGYFNVTHDIPPTQNLGSVVLMYLLNRYPRNATQDVRVVANTSLVCNVPVTILSGDLFNVSTMLKDDLEQPIAGATIQLRCDFKNPETLANNTENSGTAEFDEITVPEPAENFTCEAYFNGTMIYLPCSYFSTVNVNSNLNPPGFMWILPVVLSTSIFFFFFTVSALVWRRKKNRDVAEQGLAEVTPEQVLNKQKTGLSIEFPQILPPFPNVWAVKEPLTVKLRLDGQNGAQTVNVRLTVNGQNMIMSKTLNKGCAEVTRIFENKGAYALQAALSGDGLTEDVEAEVQVRIVDYKEEVVDLFNSFFKTSRQKFQNLRDELTPRELQNVISVQTNDSKHEPLETIVSVFEIADYSLHPITRIEYEKMFLAVKQFEG
jgi:hypothetical protein